MDPNPWLNFYLCATIDENNIGAPKIQNNLLFSKFFSIAFKSYRNNWKLYNCKKWGAKKEAKNQFTKR